MAQSGSGFDMSKMSMGTKILLGSGALLLFFSFFVWEKECVAGLGCVDQATMWGGSGAVFGILGGIALMALILWEGFGAVGTPIDVGRRASEVGAYLGFATTGLVLLRFIFALTSDPALVAFIGFILALGVGYGAWMRFQEPVAMPAAPTAPPANEGLA